MVTIYTYADKRPDFIALQKRTFDRFVKDDFELVVYNNGSSPELIEAIDAACTEAGVESIRVEGARHSDPNVACAYPIQWSFHERIKFDDDLAVVIDSDMFLLAPFSFRTFVGDYHICAVKQRREHVKYLWNGIVFLNVPAIPLKDEMNWYHGTIEGVPTDVGGHLYHWLGATSGQLRLRNIDFSGDIASRYGNLFCLPKELRAQYREGFDFQIYGNAFFHYKRGSNWNRQSAVYHEQKSQLAIELIEGCIDGRYMLPAYDYAFKFPEPNGSDPPVMNYWEDFDEGEVSVPVLPSGTGFRQSLQRRVSGPRRLLRSLVHGGRRILR